MAKTILTSFLVVTTICGYAQESVIFEQNRVLLGGGVSFSFYDRNDSDTFDNNPDLVEDLWSHSYFTFTPIIGAFSKDYVMLGIKPTISRRETSDSRIDSDSETNWEHKSFEYGASLFISHMYPLYKRFGATLEHEAGYKRYQGTSDRQWTYLNNDIVIDENSYDYTEKGNRYFAGISLMLYYAFTDNFLVQTKIGQLAYQHGNTTVTDDRNDGERVDKRTVSSGDLNFITTLSFDKILTLNYLF